MSLELPNVTLLFQFLFFMGAVFFLQFFVFRPVVAVIEERKKKTVEALRQAEQMSVQAASYLEKFQEGMSTYKDELRDQRDKVKKTVMKEQENQMDTLKEELSGSYQRAQGETSRQLLACKEKLADEVKALSQDVFKKLSQA